MKFKKFKKIVKVVTAYMSRYECHHNISEDIDSIIKEEEKIDGFSYEKHLLKFHHASDDAIYFLLDVIFGKECAALVNSFIYRKVYGDDVMSPYSVRIFDNLKDLYDHIEKKKSPPPILVLHEVKKSE